MISKAQQKILKKKKSVPKECQKEAASFKLDLWGLKWVVIRK